MGLMKPNYIDAHAHLNFDRFDDDRADVLAEMQEKGIGAINIGVDAATSAASIELAAQNDHIWATAGCHPTEVHEDFDIDLYRGLIEKDADQIVAVGECGFDYFRSADRGDKEKQLQRTAFEAQIQLAITADLPLVLHMRPQAGSMDAYEDGLDMLEYYAAEYAGKLRGTAHFFVGDSRIAARFLNIGFYISATGVVTFDEDLQRTFAEIPTDRLLVETDAPFAAPAPHHGRRNSPLYIPDILASLARITGTEEEKLAPQVLSSTRRLFSL